jgi:putative ATPase
MSEPDKLQTAQTLAQLIPPGGKLVLAETVPRYTQRLYRLLQPHSLDASLYKRLVDAEEAMYVSQSDPMLNWDADDLPDAFASTGLVVDMVVEQNSTQMHISSTFLERLFATKGNRPSYAQRLGEKLTLEELERLKATFTQCLLNQTIDWQSAIAFLKAYKV